MDEIDIFNNNIFIVKKNKTIDDIQIHILERYNMHTFI